MTEIEAERGKARIHAKYAYDTMGISNAALRNIQTANQLITNLNHIEDTINASEMRPAGADDLERDRKILTDALKVALAAVVRIRDSKVNKGVELERRYSGFPAYKRSGKLGKLAQMVKAAKPKD